MNFKKEDLKQNLENKQAIHLVFERAQERAQGESGEEKGFGQQHGEDIHINVPSHEIQRRGPEVPIEALEVQREAPVIDTQLPLHVYLRQISYRIFLATYTFFLFTFMTNIAIDSLIKRASVNFFIGALFIPIDESLIYKFLKDGRQNKKIYNSNHSINNVVSCGVHSRFGFMVVFLNMPLESQS